MSERGDQQSSFIHFGYWDSLKMGLLAGERLHYDLRRMDAAYLDQNRREYEISKHISLVLFDPMALIALKETGHCLVTLPEALFDMDYPGHYMRRIKSFTLTIPCVTGPYTSINCTVTLPMNKIRFGSTSENYQESPNGSDPRFAYNFAPLQSIATSHAQNDSGMFELNFRDERYLPFEGAGVISRWRIDMPKENNAFDFESISDVIMNLNYTSRDAGDLLRAAARTAALPPPALLRMFSLKHEFSNEWYRFLHPADADPQQNLQFDLTQERFPFQYRGRNIQIQQADVFLKLKDTYNPPADQTPLSDYKTAALRLHVTAPSGNTNTGDGTLNSVDSFFNGLPNAIDLFPKQPQSLGTWLFQFQSGDKNSGDKSGDIAKIAATLRTAGTPPHLNPEVIQDIMMVCHYSVA